MKRIYTFSGFIFFIMLFSLLTTHASAQESPQGLDLQINVNVPAMASDYHFNGDYWLHYWAIGVPAGIGLDLVFGYRWTHFGIYLSQEIGGVFSSDPFDKESEWGYEDTHDAWFLGGTYLEGMGFIQVSDKLEMNIGLGAGMMYSSRDRVPDSSGSSGGYVVETPDKRKGYAFAFKFVWGMTYYFMQNLGFGFNLNYDLGIASGSSYNDYCTKGRKKCSETDLTHVFNPGVHLDVRF